MSAHAPSPDGRSAWGEGWVSLGAAQLGDKTAAPGATLSLPESDVPWLCFPEAAGGRAERIAPARARPPASAARGDWRRRRAGPGCSPLFWGDTLGTDLVPYLGG